MSAEPQTLTGVRLAAHPRAVAQIRRAKGAGGLVGFAVAAWMTHRTGGDAAEVLAWGLGAGVACWLVAWAAAVTAWRALMVAEMRDARNRAIARAEELAAEAAERAAAEVAERERLEREGPAEAAEPPTGRRRRRS